ncbi:MAG: maleate cis-trans isomerase [Saccharolobus sp.]
MKWLKVGIILPSSNTTVEREFNQISNEIDQYKITFHASRIRLDNVTLNDLDFMERETERATYELATLNPNIIAYACTSGSFFRGPKHYEEIVHRIERIAKVQAVATSGSVLKALNKLNIKKVVLVTPYIDEVNKREVEFLSANGIYVAKSKGMGIVRNTDIGSVEPEEVYKFVLNSLNGVSDFDGVFISCTNLRTFEIIDKLEKEIGKPVISSNTATLWEIFHRLNIGVEKLGTLFKNLR